MRRWAYRGNSRGRVYRQATALVCSRQVVTAQAPGEPEGGGLSSFSGREHELPGRDAEVDP